MNLKVLFLFKACILLSSVVIAQNQPGGIIKITYQSIPLTQYNIDADAAQNSGVSKVDVLGAIKDYYSLYINLEDNSSLYVLDSMVSNVPEGTGVSLATKVDYVIKTPKRSSHKLESVMGQRFYSTGGFQDISWTLLDDTRTINGLKCHKAEAKNEYLMLTAWYTKDIPVAEGPSIYHSLPGLVVWVEDFFRTIELVKVYHLEPKDINYHQLYKSYETDFHDSKNSQFREKENLLMIKKADAANNLYQMIHGESYRRPR